MSRFESFGISDVGRKRANNEDAFAIRADNSLYIVADGMGGHSSGEIAAQLAVREIIAFFDTTPSSEDATWPYDYDENLSFEANRLRTAIAAANDRIQAYAANHPESRGMGTTVVAALFNGERAVISHVGDSRAYLLRDHELEVLTMDHSWVGEQVRQGFLTEQEAEQHPFRNVITKALGTREQAQGDVVELAMTEGSRLLLCTDGLNSMVRDEEIKDILAHTGGLEETCRKLIDMANEKGGEDNITVVLVDRVE